MPIFHRLGRVFKCTRQALAFCLVTILLRDKFRVQTQRTSHRQGGDAIPKRHRLPLQIIQFQSLGNGRGSSDLLVYQITPAIVLLFSPFSGSVIRPNSILRHLCTSQHLHSRRTAFQMQGLANFAHPLTHYPLSAFQWAVQADWTTVLF